MMTVVHIATRRGWHKQPQTNVCAAGAFSRCELRMHFAHNSGGADIAYDIFTAGLLRIHRAFIALQRLLRDHTTTQGRPETVESAAADSEWCRRKTGLLPPTQQPLFPPPPSTPPFQPRAKQTPPRDPGSRRDEHSARPCEESVATPSCRRRRK
eukprot:m.1346148 g.1346148  ORF g.1346148 m.1346148 type:complete len:154 (+) comp24904_c0_seq61:2347-2808(+)